MKADNAITEFRGQFRFLSNFWPVTVTFDGVEYRSVEHAYQAAKADDLQQRKKICDAVKPGDAKRMGRYVCLRADWEQVKLSIMLHLVRQKFYYPEMRMALAGTGERELIEGNHWGDRFWGMVWENSAWNGENHLGKILMQVRKELAA